MKNVVLFYLLLLFTLTVTAQRQIKGTVKDEQSRVVSGASVSLMGSSAGAITDSNGRFNLMIPVTGRLVLGVSAVGFKSWRQELLPGDSIFDIRLQNSTRSLREVTISAGAFEASDKAKGASLTPIDAVTVAGSNADITQALRSLPGAQQIGEQEGLFVRGGTGAETKQFIDGTLLRYPNYPAVPGIQQYARINPFLYKGILFSSGGYSALYGQAMSSALILESVDLPDKSSASFSLFPANIGAGLQQVARNRRSSYGVSLAYSDQSFYNNIVPQQPDYFSDPRYLNGNANFRIKTGKNGMLKFYTNWSSSRVGMYNPDVDSPLLRAGYLVKGQNIYGNLSYRGYIGTRWKIDAGTAYSFNRVQQVYSLQSADGKNLYLPEEPYRSKTGERLVRSNFAQARVVLTHTFAREQALRFGAEHFYTADRGFSNDSTIGLTDHLSAAFAEGDIRLAPALAVRAGLRVEYSSLLRQWAVAPRAGIAYRLHENGQLGVAYGIFYQSPDNEWLYFNTGLGFTKASHYVLNYTLKQNNRFLRAEIYYKQYDDLIKTTPVTANNGNGYAKGAELFYRDKRTFKNLDYWVTYTFLDTRRDFLNYPYRLEPSFAAPHTGTVAIKKFFPSLSAYVNVSYAVAAGRPYYDIRYDNAAGSFRVYDQGRSKTYSVMNLHVAWLTSFFKNWKQKDFSGIAFGVNNLLGTQQVFGYRYSANGMYKQPYTLPATRSYFVGVFISLGIDRTDDFLNNNL